MVLLSIASLALAACATAPPTFDTAGLPDPLHAGWKGEAVCEQLEDNESLRVLRCTFPPGVGHEKHFHAPHFGYALKGGNSHIQDARGERDATTPDGYSWWTGETTVHANQNTGDATSVYLIIEPKRPRS
jgi:quercetin dioxygenase-like cupin family protein